MGVDLWKGWLINGIVVQRTSNTTSLNSFLFTFELRCGLIVISSCHVVEMRFILFYHCYWILFKCGSLDGIFMKPIYPSRSWLRAYRSIGFELKVASCPPVIGPGSGACRTLRHHKLSRGIIIDSLISYVERSLLMARLIPTDWRLWQVQILFGMNGPISAFRKFYR